VFGSLNFDEDGTVSQKMRQVMEIEIAYLIESSEFPIQQPFGKEWH